MTFLIKEKYIYYRRVSEITHKVRLMALLIGLRMGDPNWANQYFPCDK